MKKLKTSITKLFVEGKQVGKTTVKKFKKDKGFMIKGSLLKPKKDESKNFKLSYEFYSFCRAHPELRFWQALMAWTGVEIGVGSLDRISVYDFGDFGFQDPFYWKGKDK